MTALNVLGDALAECGPSAANRAGTGRHAAGGPGHGPHHRKRPPRHGMSCTLRSGSCCVFVPGQAGHQNWRGFPSLGGRLQPAGRRSGKGLSASSLISCCDVSHIAFHSEASRRGRHHRLGSRDVRSTGLRVRRVRTRREIGRACNRSGAGAPRFGLRERPRCGGTATRAATPSPGLRRSQRDGRDTRQKAAKAAYRKLPTAPADLRAAAVRRSCGFCADACPIAKRRVARMRDGGARRIQGVPYLSTSDRLSSQIPRPWVAA